MTVVPNIELIPEFEETFPSASGELRVLVRIQPRSEAESSGRTPLNLGLVLDRSGSMGGEKLRRAKEAACAFIDRLTPADRFGLVAFDTEVEVWIPSTQAGDREALKKAVGTIIGGSRTALHEAWIRGGLEVVRHMAANAVNRVILLTDGIANVGETRTGTIVHHVAELAKRGVSTSTVGIGFDFNEDLLIPMAEAGGGNASHVVHPADINRVLALELDNINRQVGHSVRLKLKARSGFRVADLLNDFAANADGELELPNLRLAQPLDIVVVLKAFKTPPFKRILNVLGVELSWIGQSDGRRRTQSLDLDLTVAFRSARRFEPRVRKAACLLTVARLKRRAVRCIDEGQPEQARNVILEALRLTAGVRAELGNDPDLGEQLRLLDGFEAELARNADPTVSRKLLAYQSYQTSTCRFG